MPEESSSQISFSKPISVFRKIKKVFDLIIIPLIVALTLLYFLASSPWVTNSFAKKRVLNSLDPSCRESNQDELLYPEDMIDILKIPTLKERLGLDEPLFGNEVTINVLCGDKGTKNTYFVSFYGSIKSISSRPIELK